VAERERSVEDVDEVDVRRDVDVAVIYQAEAGTTPGEVHLADQHPIVVRGDGHSDRPVTDALGALFTAVEEDRRPGHRPGAAWIRRVLEDVRMIVTWETRAPVAEAKARPRDGVDRVGR